MVSQSGGPGGAAWATGLVDRVETKDGPTAAYTYDATGRALAATTGNQRVAAWTWDKADVSGQGRTWQKTVKVTGPATDQEQFCLGIQITNMPTDGYYALSIPGPDAANTVNIPKTRIMTPNMNQMVAVQWPASYSTAATLIYWEGATAPPSGATLQLMLLIPTDQGNLPAMNGAQNTQVIGSIPFRF